MNKRIKYDYDFIDLDHLLDTIYFDLRKGNEKPEGNIHQIQDNVYMMCFIGENRQIEIFETDESIYVEFV